MIFSAILEVLKLIAEASKTPCENTSQSRQTSLELAEQVKELFDLLHGTAPVHERLEHAIRKALRLIKYCQEGGIFSGKNWCNKVTELDKDDKATSNSITYLMSTIYNSYYNKPKGGASSACIGLPSPHHAGSTSQAPYYQPPCDGYPSSVLFPGSPPYPAYPACAEEDAILNRVLEESHVSARAEDAAARNRVLDESRTTAALNRVLEESRVSARAEEDAILNCVLEESRVSARAEEDDAILNLVLEESRALEEEDMVRALCAAVQS